MRFLHKFSFLLRRSRYNAELEEEMTFHREEAERLFVADGMSGEAAHRAAARQFGNSTQLKDRSAEVVRFNFETVIHDIRFGLRQLMKNPGFGVMAILILALGIGVSVAIFGFVDAALLQPLPFAQPDRLLAVSEKADGFPIANLSYEDYLDWKRMNTTVSSLEVYTGTGYLLHLGSITEPVPAGRVSAGFFSTLGVRPVLGRDFRPGEDQPGKPKIVMLPYGTWQKRFSGRSDIIGQSVSLSGDSYTIVGVLPRGFSFARRGDAEFWTPLLDHNGCEKRRGCHNFDGIARLRDGVSWRAALADFENIAAHLEKQYPDTNRGQGAFVEPLSELLLGDIRPILLTLLGGAALLFLIACVNVANLMLVRSESRRREVAVRGALGATRIRLARQFITEGLLLAAGGCLAGLLIAVWTMSLLTHLVPKSAAASLPFLGLVGLNVHTAVAACGVAVLAALLVALTPVARLFSMRMQDELAEGNRGIANRFWRRLGANLVVVEITVAVVLLCTAGLLGKSFYRLLHVDVGFNTDRLAAVYSMAPEKQYVKDEQKNQLYDRIKQSIGQLPGVQSVALASDLPLHCNCNSEWIRISGKPFHGEHNEVLERDVSREYLRTLQARLLRGRLPAEGDKPGSPRVAVINESLARRYFPGEDPVGKTILDFDANPKNARQIIGVVADVREGALDADLWPAEYRMLEQDTSNYFAVVVRTAGSEKALLPGIVSAIRSIDPNLGVYGEIAMQQQLETTQTALLHRCAAWLVGGFALVALVLGVLGLYGVVAFSVSQRTREIGVRIALGAQRSTVYAMVLRQAAWLTCAGVGIGWACAIASAVLMRKLLFDVRAWDVPTLAAVAFVLASAALLAAFVPARRATRVNPMEALRTE